MAYEPKEFSDLSDHPINSGYGNYKDYDPLRPRGFEDEEEMDEETKEIQENVVTIVNRGDFDCTNDSFS